MQVKNNNVSFSGLGIIGKVKAENLCTLNKYLTNQSFVNNVKMLERSCDTDVFFNTKVSTLTMKHKSYGNLAKYGLPKISTDDFLKNFSVVISEIKKASSLGKEAADIHSAWLDEVCKANKLI